MRKRSNNYKKAVSSIDETRFYTVDEALDLVKKTGFAKFDETVDLAFRLGVDPRHADQMIRGAVTLPAGMGKNIKVAVVTSEDKINLAKEAGADQVGGDDLIQKILKGEIDFDRLIASPDMMGKLGKVGRILGPRGLMPNPKLGTVVVDVAKAVTEQKAGKAEYRSEKSGIVHVSMGKKSFDTDKLKQNFRTLMEAILKAKPVSAKGEYIRGLTISCTMGPGIKIDVHEAVNIA